MSDAADVLVVVSKIKKYIKATANMNTAGNVSPKLSEAVRRMCMQAVEKAKSDGRKTVMDRDFD